MVEIAEIRSYIEGNNGRSYLAHMFTEVEQAYCSTVADPYQSFAGKLAAKEALLKALGTGWTGEIEWTQIEIRNEDSGRPSVVVSGRVAALLDERRIKSILVSVSHVPQYAVAIVTLEG